MVFLKSPQLYNQYDPYLFCLQEKGEGGLVHGICIINLPLTRL